MYIHTRFDWFKGDYNDRLSTIFHILTSHWRLFEPIINRPSGPQWTLSVFIDQDTTWSNLNISIDHWRLHARIPVLLQASTAAFNTVQSGYRNTSPSPQTACQTTNEPQTFSTQSGSYSGPAGINRCWSDCSPCLHAPAVQRLTSELTANTHRCAQQTAQIQSTATTSTVRHTKRVIYCGTTA